MARLVPRSDEGVLTYELSSNLLEWVVVILAAFVSLYTAGHALLYKRDPRAALGWIAICLMFPLAGPLLYLIFGVNRVRTRARKLRHLSFIDFLDERPEPVRRAEVSRLDLDPALVDLARVSEAVTGQPLVAGNRLEAMHNGEQAYPAMLRAIDEARESVYLVTYIFETNHSGYQFIDALSRAAERGVDVKVLIDGIGELYSWPRAGSELRKRKVPVARFLPPKLIPPTLHINLRNHRKILVADGHVGFTGGMNIGDRHLADDERRKERVVDSHFRVVGPVAAQMAVTFLEDWRFCTGEEGPPPKTASPASGGNAICRVISDGPNEDMDRLSVILIAAISRARSRIAIMTPYFLPSREMIAVLQSAALRGVQVDLILPARNNLPFVHWATRNMLWELVHRDVRVYYQPPPFVHTKLFVIDGSYAQIGSANIDPRSLRLNFELNVEIYDKEFASTLDSYVQRTRQESRQVTLEELDGRPMPVRLRDALAWLFSPYL